VFANEPPQSAHVRALLQPKDPSRAADFITLLQGFCLVIDPVQRIRAIAKSRQKSA